MKIATWNIERLKHKAKIDSILLACNQRQADILVLTETDSQVQPDYKYCIQTPDLAEIQPNYYKRTENRVSIYTNFPCIQTHKTFDKYTAICAELKTDIGNLCVYGTIIGIYGSRHPSFQQDLDRQIKDWENLSANGNNICVIGDYNCTFCDDYYYTKKARNDILQCFSKHKINLLTHNELECIDHIAISDKFITGNIEIEEWNLGKELSDHKGIMVTFCSVKKI